MVQDHIGPYGPGPLWLNGPEPFIIWKNFLSHMPEDQIWSAHCSRSMFASYMLLEQCALQIWSWNILDLEYPSNKVLMFQDHMVPDHILDHKSRPKCQKSGLNFCHLLPNIEHKVAHLCGHYLYLMSFIISTLFPYNYKTQYKYYIHTTKV